MYTLVANVASLRASLTNHAVQFFETGEQNLNNSSFVERNPIRKVPAVKKAISRVVENLQLLQQQRQKTQNSSGPEKDTGNENGSVKGGGESDGSGEEAVPPSQKKNRFCRPISKWGILVNLGRYFVRFSCTFAGVKAVRWDWNIVGACMQRENDAKPAWWWSSLET